MICENKRCGKEHDGSFGSGRFCSIGCANSREQTPEMNGARRLKLEKPETHKFCKCGTRLHRLNTSGFCKKCKPRVTHTQSIQTLRRKRKQRAVDYKGGKCIVCGYDKCNRALDFHHVLEEEKEFTISSNLDKNWEIVKKELDKCVLVCGNCHMEIHESLIDIEYFMLR